jgi:hypothetical protein
MFRAFFLLERRLHFSGFCPESEGCGECEMYHLVQRLESLVPIPEAGTQKSPGNVGGALKFQGLADHRGCEPRPDQVRRRRVRTNGFADRVERRLALREYVPRGETAREICCISGH